MADATRKTQHNACVSAIRSPEPMPPAARLWLARASLHADPKGRTNYGPARCGTDIGLDPDHIDNGIRWLLARGLVLHDHNDQGIECWRLAHTDWTGTNTIGGYSRDAGQTRDGHPPQYGRTVADVIEPLGQPYTSPPDTHWTRLVTEEPT